MKHKQSKHWELLKVVDGKIKRPKNICPRCGEGTYMAEHKDRFYCGKCHFSEWKK